MDLVEKPIGLVLDAAVTPITTFVSDFVRSFFSAVRHTFIDLVDWLGKGMSDVTDSVKSFLQDIMNAVENRINAVVAMIEHISMDIAEAPGKIFDIFDIVLQRISDAFTSAIDALKSGMDKVIQTLEQSIEQAFVSIEVGIKEVLSDITKQLEYTTQQASNELEHQFDTVSRQLISAATKDVSVVENYIEKPVKLINIDTDVVSALDGIIKQGLNYTVTGIQDAGELISDTTFYINLAIAITVVIAAVAAGLHISSVL